MLPRIYNVRKIQEQNARQRHELKSEEHRKLLAYYNGEADKTGLGAILAQVNALSAEANRLIGDAREAEEIQRRCHREHEQARIDLAIGESNLKQAQEEWLQVSERARKAREEA